MKPIALRAAATLIAAALSTPILAGCGGTSTAQPSSPASTAVSTTATQGRSTEFPPTKIDGLSRITESAAFNAFSNSRYSMPSSSMPTPATAQQYSDAMKQWGTADFNQTFGVSTSNIKSTSIYEYGDPALLPKSRSQNPVPPQILFLIVFTLNDDFVVDQQPALEAAKAQMSAQGAIVVGDGGLYNPVTYTGVGKHKLIIGYYQSSDDDTSATVLKHLGEQIDASGTLK
ncbi:hypothetical protein [Arthrobacter methylotrophus]|uniref:hypothetical protein n=1 Tax=Arthrobacter methylotrophus TaxID=121291 RepID=UPI0031E79EF8